MSEWRSQTLDDVIELQRGHDLPTVTRGEGTVPVIGSFGITGYHDAARYPGPGVAIGRSGASIGVATYCPSPYWPLNTCLFVKDFRGNDPRWVYYLLDSIDFSSFNSGSAQPSLNRNYLKGIPVPTPPLAEQRAIAGVLGALDDKIESNSRLLTLLEAEVQACFGRDFDVEPCADGVFLSELIDINPKRVLQRGTEAPYVAMADLPTSTALIDAWTVRSAGSGQRFVNGDALVARITPCLENGKTAFVDILEYGEVGWGSTEYIVLRSVAPLPLEWAYCLARSGPFREFAIRNMTGTSGRQRCPASAFDSYRLRAPEPSAVERFALSIGGSFARMGKARDESRVLAALRDALLPELLSGRLSVRDVEAIAEDVA